MTLKRNMQHPNFTVGLISYLLLLIGVVLLSTNITLGRQFIIGSFITGAIHWIGSLMDVWTDPDLEDEKSRYFWLAIVTMVPPLAGMMYYMVEGRKFSY